MLFRIVVGLVCIVLFALSPIEVHGQGAVGSLRRLLESGRVPADRQGTILEMICTRGEPDDLAAVFQLLDRPGALTPAMKRKVLELLADAATTRKVKPSGDLSSLAKLVESAEAAKDRRLQAAAIRLAAVWKLSAI